MGTNTSHAIKDVFPNLLLITGSGRERGKTLHACNIINEWKKKFDLVAIKISAHSHGDTNSKNFIHSSGNYSIWEEREISSKDSGRFREAGPPAGNPLHPGTRPDHGYLVKGLLHYWPLSQGFRIIQP